MVTMTLDEIKNLENITYSEDTYYIYITPNQGYYLLIEDYPEYRTYYDTVKMIKQENYSTIIVKKIDDPSVYLNSDTSINSSVF